VTELDHHPVSGAQLGQQFVQTQLGDEGLQRLAGLGVIGDGDFDRIAFSWT
jgi:hypothetical protein